MDKKDLPTPEMLRNLLRYEPDTGKLFWRERAVEMFGCKDPQRAQKIFNTRYAGIEAFTCVNAAGYKNGRIFNQGMTAHRVAWAISNNKWPEEDIDHINGDRTDNRIENLRVVSRGQNCKNQRMRAANKSGVMGVMFEAERGKWSARIGHDKKTIHLGRFDTFDEAAEARRQAEKKYGYHANHGR